jgi:hypothetical protein
VHLDDLGAREQLEAQGVTDAVGWTHEDDVDAERVGGLAGALDDLAGRLVTTDGVDGDR